MFRRRHPRLKGLSFNRMIPNILTVLALCAGLTSIRFGMQERWEWAVAAIILAAIFDGLDGRLARMMGGTSRFGAELDSLSDFVSFGVAPALLLYLWTMRFAGGLGWALVLLFGVCCALRLARFNTKSRDSDLPAYAFNFFTGVPAPAAAGLVLMPMMLSFQLDSIVFGLPAVNGVVIVLVAFLMISRIPTYSFKKLRVPHQWVLPSLLFVGLLAAGLTSAPWTTFTLVGAAYLASIPFSLRSFRILQTEAKRLQTHSQETAEVHSDERVTSIGRR